jgi:hypothetical protein
MSLVLNGLGLTNALAGTPGATPKIINGEEASAEDYPMTGGMLIDANMSFNGSGGQQFRTFICSSTPCSSVTKMVTLPALKTCSFLFFFVSGETFEWRSPLSIVRTPRKSFFGDSNPTKRSRHPQRNGCLFQKRQNRREAVT